MTSTKRKITSTKRKIWQEGYDAHSHCTVNQCPYNAITQMGEWVYWVDGFNYADTTKQQ
jgi:hypothetical protein